MTPLEQPFDTVLVVDFGAQYAQLIARRVREAHVYSEIVPRDMPVAEMLAKRPAGIIFSGGPKSVHVEGAPSIDPAVYEHLGIDDGATTARVNSQHRAVIVAGVSKLTGFLQDLGLIDDENRFRVFANNSTTKNQMLI